MVTLRPSETRTPVDLVGLFNWSTVRMDQFTGEYMKYVYCFVNQEVLINHPNGIKDKLVGMGLGKSS